MDFTETIAKCRAIATARNAPRKTVTDEQVAARMALLAEAGYVPSADTIGPVRACLEGYGVLLTGSVGSGKTLLLRLLTCPACMQHVTTINDWGMAGIEDWFCWWDGKQCVIDDLAAERTTVEFGNREDLMKLVIGHRAERQTGRTHITTNLSAQQIATRYGDRILDRILGMCKPFTISGPSHRVAVQQVTP
jgi:hypothetical protein